MGNGELKIGKLKWEKDTNSQLDCFHTSADDVVSIAAVFWGCHATQRPPRRLRVMQFYSPEKTMLYYRFMFILIFSFNQFQFPRFFCFGTSKFFLKLNHA